ILTEGAELPYVEPSAARALHEWRADLSELLRRNGPAVQLDEKGARWWIFGGGRINYTLKHALEWTTGWRVVADNLRLRLEGAGADSTGTPELFLQGTDMPFRAQTYCMNFRSRLPR